MNFEHLQLNKQLCHRLYLASNAATRAYRPHLDKLGITYPQYLVLMALWEKDGVEIKQLKEKTHIDSGALTLILKKLETKGILSVAKDDKDKRIKIVSLTEQGQELKIQAADIPQALKCKIPSLTDDDLENIKRIMDKVIIDLT